MALDHVLWLGGGSGSGKTTIGRELAHRFDLQLYPVDAHGYDHLARKTGVKPSGGCDVDAQWLDPTPQMLASRFLAGGEENFPLILEDLEAMAGGLLVAEGPTLFPDLVSPHLASDRG